MDYQEQSNPLCYIFKIRKCPHEHKDLLEFENNLVELMRMVKFKPFRNKFQEQLKYSASLKKSQNVYIIWIKLKI